MLVFLAGLVAEALLPISPAINALLIGLWVLICYGAVVFWIRLNRGFLHRESWSLDSDDRPIADSETRNSTEHQPSEGKQNGQITQPTPRAFGGSEVESGW
jgi:hypothetical protein